MKACKNDFRLRIQTCLKGLFCQRIERGRCKATTLPELLVAMAIGGMVCILTFEAWNMLEQWGKRWVEKNASESMFFTAVSRLEALCRSADSLVTAGDKLYFRRPEGNEVYLQQEGECLVVYFRDRDTDAEVSRDTLFQGIEHIRWEAESRAEQRTDSLYVFFRTGERIKFGCPFRQTIPWEELFQREEKEGSGTS